MIREETVVASIMIVDDDDNIREYLEFLLSNTRFDTFMAPNGVDTIEAMQTIRPDLLLVDIKMPRMDGIEVLRRIRSDPKFKLLPVIMVTSSLEEKDLIESYKLGANSYVVKPVDIVQFIEAIKVLGQYWAGINEPPPMHV